MALIYNATFDKNTRKLSFEDKAGNEIYSFTVPEREKDDITKPLTFKATQDGSTVKLIKDGSPSGTFQTSTDGGNTWVDYTLDTAITLNTGDEVSFRAKTNRGIHQDLTNYFKFVMKEGKIEAWHNMMSMYRTSDFATYKTIGDYAFSRLFGGCTSLTKAPALPVTKLTRRCYAYMFWGCTSLTKAPELPETTLVKSCYEYMFKNCTSLTEAPVLPATTLADYCYAYMFSGCQSLTKAPELPATTLALYCYQNMFDGCTSLTKAPALPVTILTDYCYASMFNGCTSLTKAPALPVATLADYCYRNMFNGCSSLNEVHFKISSVYSSSRISECASNWLKGVAPTGTFYTNADANWASGESGIPTGWNRVNEGAPTDDDHNKSLTFKATQDGSTVKLTKKGIPSGYFQTSRDGRHTWEDYTLDTAITLNTGDEVSFRARADRASWQSSDDYFQFVMTGKIEAWHNVMSLYRTYDFATYNTVGDYSFYRLFGGCTSLTKAPVLPATRLADYCYSSMFSGCTSLIKAPVLPATTLATDCYAYMFSGCLNLTKAPELPVTTLANGCYSDMFYNCQSLTKAPELPATTLADYCYYDMFSGCQSLTKAPELPATTLADYCYNSMFSGCQSLTKAPVLPATTLPNYCYQGMFAGCQSLKEVRISATTTATNALDYWLSSVSATGDFYCDPNATIFPTGASGIPEGWTRHALADYPVTP